MNIENPFFSIIPMTVALITAFFISTVMRVKENTHNRFKSIDGLRGYLALFVFMHHSVIWYYYLRVGKWQLPMSNLFINYGQIGVAIFFMITGFLFSLKLFDARKKGEEIDWIRLFVSRFLRLTPLYVFVVAILIYIVLFLSDFHLKITVSKILTQVFYWLGFTIFGFPDINGVENTSIIVAGVFWSLPYEWLFYLTLPLLGLLVGVNAGKSLKILSILSVLTIILFGFYIDFNCIYYFLSGIVAAYFVGNETLVRFSSWKYTSPILFTLLVCAFFLINTAYDLMTFLILFVFFVAVSNGNTFFGILTARMSILLGEIAYSIYLLHGMIIFVVFKILIAPEIVSLFLPLQHWLVISICAFILVIFSFITYRLIEFPAMQKVTYLSNLIHIIFSHYKDQRFVVKR